MATLTFILGLCGSGKTWLADRIVAARKFDEGFLRDADQHAALFECLRNNQDCVVVEISYCDASYRKQILEKLKTANIPGMTITWLCIENDLYRANKNCRERTNKGDPEEHIKINQELSRFYTYPDGGVILKMWTK